MLVKSTPTPVEFFGRDGNSVLKARIMTQQKNCKRIMSVVSIEKLFYYTYFQAIGALSLSGDFEGSVELMRKQAVLDGSRLLT
jgi:hypothetical protein